MLHTIEPLTEAILVTAGKEPRLHFSVSSRPKQVECDAVYEIGEDELLSDALERLVTQQVVTFAQAVSLAVMYGGMQ